MTNLALRRLPGIALCAIVAASALSVQALEEQHFGRPYLEALVMAILIGTVIRSLWTPNRVFVPGIAFSAKQLLEIAVFLLGASISAKTVLAAGPGLLVGIVLVVTLALGSSYLIGRKLGLPRRIAILIACGNSICGNSAIAAVAPVIHADSDDVASSIAFTAVLGVVMVLALPLLIPVLTLSYTQYGVLAGLTVYAVPQVLAATVPVGLVSTQIGTLVKLVRVLMLGPVVLVLSLLASRLDGAPAHPGAAVAGGPKPKVAFSKMVPWFILGFLFLMALRSLGLVPDFLLEPIARATGMLTVVAMAALGLGVDIRVVARAGGPVTLAVVASMLVLVGISIALIYLLGVV